MRVPVSARGIHLQASRSCGAAYLFRHETAEMDWPFYSQADQGQPAKLVGPNLLHLDGQGDICGRTVYCVVG